MGMIIDDDPMFNRNSKGSGPKPDQPLEEIKFEKSSSR